MFCVDTIMKSPLRQASREMTLYIIVFCDHLDRELRFPHKNDVRFVLTSSGLEEGSHFIYVICVCLCIVVSNTYCVVFLFCFSSSCPFLIAPSFITLTFIYDKRKYIIYIYNVTSFIQSFWVLMTLLTAQPTELLSTSGV